ncbi:MAG TPA: carboxylesterase family protein, partial [Clostridia bacterium]|nr:carboxylesterase family protein [Clostridia bacterium]
MKKFLSAIPVTFMCLALGISSVFSAGATIGQGKADMPKSQEQSVKTTGASDELKKLNEQFTALQASAFINSEKADKQKALLSKEITGIINKVESGNYDSASKNLNSNIEKNIKLWVARAEQPKLFKSIDIAAISIKNASKTTVKTTYGKVAGADAGNGSWIWAGIPYAKPPVGKLRWKAPQDPEPWNKIRQSTYNFSRCTQIVIDAQWNPVNKIRGSEDCLYLNVFRPKTNTKNLPVYFYIHGGGHAFDGADAYDASILA